MQEHSSSLFQRSGVLKFVDAVKFNAAIAMFRAFFMNYQVIGKTCLNSIFCQSYFKLILRKTKPSYIVSTATC